MTLGPSNIQKYNNMMSQARDCEKVRNWQHAEKLWKQCHELAVKNHWDVKAQWCINRSTFCEMMAKRAA